MTTTGAYLGTLKHMTHALEGSIQYHRTVTRTQLNGPRQRIAARLAWLLWVRQDLLVSIAFMEGAIDCAVYL